MATHAQDLADSFELFFVESFAEMLPGTKLEMDSYLEYLCNIFENLRRRERLVLNLPPRSLKTTITIAYAAWFLGRHPNKSILILCNKQDLGEEYLIRPLRQILESSWYSKVFPKTQIKKRGATASGFATTRGGRVLASSVESSLAGYGADLMILDDPNRIADANNPDRLKTLNDKYGGEIYSRLNNKKQSIVLVIQHRLHEDDLSGHLIKLGYRRIALPLIAPRDKTYALSGGETWERKKGDVLSRNHTAKDIASYKRSNIDFFWFYQQGRGTKERNSIRMEDFKLIRSRKSDGPFVISIDTAQAFGGRSSFNVVQVWQKLPASYHLFEQFRAQCSFADLQTETISLIRKFQPSAILVEEAANGFALLSALRSRLQGYNFIGVPQPNQNKAERLSRHRDAIRKGALSLQSSEQSIVDVLLEFSEFPNRGTDIVDAATQFLDWANLNPIWPSPSPTRTVAPAGVGSDGRPLSRINVIESGPRGEAIARSRSIFRRF